MICPVIVVAAMARIYWQLSSDDESEWTRLPVINQLAPQPLHSQPSLRTKHPFPFAFPLSPSLFSSHHCNPHCWNCFISSLALRKCPKPLQSRPRLLDGSRLEASPFVRCTGKAQAATPIPSPRFLLLPPPPLPFLPPPPLPPPPTARASTSTLQLSRPTTSPRASRNSALRQTARSPLTSGTRPLTRPRASSCPASRLQEALQHPALQLQALHLASPARHRRLTLAPFLLCHRLLLPPSPTSDSLLSTSICLLSITSPPQAWPTTKTQRRCPMASTSSLQCPTPRLGPFPTSTCLVLTAASCPLLFKSVSPRYSLFPPLLHAPPPS